MGYLVCEKCSGYYELQEGESPEDFDDQCNCGGKLKYVENLDELKNTSGSVKKIKKCPKCGQENTDTSIFCASCGVKLKSKRDPMITISDHRKQRDTIQPMTGVGKTAGGSIVDRIMDFWNKQGTGAKAGIGIAGVCCIGIFLVIVLGGIFSGESGMSADQIKQNAVQVSAQDLYNNNGQLIGKPVKMTAEVIQSGEGFLRVAGLNIDQYGFNQGIDKPILVNGKTNNLTIYEKDIVNIYGIFKGQSSYTTVLGAEQKIPLIENAIIEPTGNKVK